MWSGVTFESILGHFGVGPPESLLSPFWVTLIDYSFCVSVELGARPLPNDRAQSAVSCGFSAKIFALLQKSAVFCGFLRLQMLEFPGEGANLQKSAVLCENLRFGRSLSP